MASNKKIQIEPLQIKLGELETIKEEIAKAGKSFVTCVSDQFNKYKLGHVYKTSWGDYVKVKNVKTLSNPQNYPNKQRLNSSVKNNIEKYPEYEIVTIEKVTDKKLLEAYSTGLLESETFSGVKYAIPQLQQFPVSNEDEVRNAISTFKRCPFGYRKQLATAILTESVKYGINISLEGPIGRHVDAEDYYSIVRNVDLKQIQESGKILSEAKGDNGGTYDLNIDEDFPEDDNEPAPNQNMDENQANSDLDNSLNDNNVGTDDDDMDYDDDDDSAYADLLDGTDDVDGNATGDLNDGADETLNNGIQDETNDYSNSANDEDSNKAMKKYYLFQKFKELMGVYIDLRDSIPSLSQNIDPKYTDEIQIINEKIEQDLTNIKFMLKQQYLKFSYDKLMYLFLRFQANLKFIVENLSKFVKKDTDSNNKSLVKNY